MILKLKYPTVRRVQAHNWTTILPIWSQTEPRIETTLLTTTKDSEWWQKW